MTAFGRGTLLAAVAAPGVARAAATGEPLTLLPPPVGNLQAGQSVSPAAELRDIHGPVPLAGQPPYGAIGGGIALLIALLAALYLLKKRRKTAPAPPPSPWQAARAELAAARALEGQGLLYMETLSEILRRYIESRFAIRSTRQTTVEFLAGLRSADGPGQLAPYRAELQACLEQADLAKFARFIPQPDDLAQMERAVSDFVDNTEPQPPGAAAAEVRP